jgi:hypothetical protein
MHVYQSRWGYHPCDFETCQRLKKLNALYEQARRTCADWQRWARKAPANRVIRRWLRDESGRKVGSEVIGPRPEPKLSLLFCTRSFVGKGDKLRPQVTFHFPWNVTDLYRVARTPAITPERVQPLPWTREELRQLVAEGEKWS